NASTVSWTVTFDQTVTGVDVTDFTLAKGSAVGVVLTQVTPVSGSVYTVSAQGLTGDGSLGLNLVDDDSIQNGSSEPLGGTGTGNGNFTGETYTLDHTGPSVTSLNRTTPSAATTNATMVSFTVTFSEAVTGVDPADFYVATD